MLVSPHEGKLQALAEGCKKRGAMDVRVICADVSKEDDCKRFIEETVNHYGGLDHLVYDACSPCIDVQLIGVIILTIRIRA